MARHHSLDIVYFVANPTITAVTPTGGVAGHYTYKLVAVDSAGGLTAASAGTAITNGPTALDATHYNTITWTDPTAAAYIMVYRTAGGTTQGLLGTVAAGVQTFKDDGVVGDGSTPSASNGTGIGAAYPTLELSGLTAQFDGTFTATLQLQGKINPAASWTNIGSAQTGAAILDVTATANTFSMIRVKTTAYTSGTPLVVIAGHFEGGGAQDLANAGSSTTLLHGGGAGYSAVVAADIASSSVTAAKLDSGALGFSAFTGHSGAGACTLTGSKVGDVVSGVVSITDGTDSAASFESTITVADQIQQSSSSNLSTKKFAVLLIKKGT